MLLIKSPKPNEKGVTEEKESSKNVPEQKSSQRRRKRKAVSLTRKKKLDENQDSESQKNQIKRSKKKKVNKEFDTIRNRCSPGSLLSVIQGFSDVQKDCVRKMGFGDILKMKMIDVPGALSCFVLQKFNSKTKKIVMEGGVIDVTRESVNQILGFPLGKTKFSSLPFRTADDNSYEKWTEQFDNKSIIRLKEIKMKIVSSNKSDMNFKLNFLALLINCLIETNRVSSKVLKVKRTRPVICHWTIEKVKIREDYEKEEIGEFGTGELNDEFIQEELNEEDYQEMILMKCRKLNLLIKNGISTFSQNVILNHLESSFVEILNDEVGDDEDDKGEEIKKRRSSRISNMVKEIPQNAESVAKVAKRSFSLKKYIKDKNVPHCEKEIATRGKDVVMQETNDKKVEDPVKDKNAPVKVKKRQYLKGCVEGNNADKEE
ncbi:unnamed protein product [Lactuca virosa]|uniref:Plus3 domain-containing protein n=1 Tax=Lactuca virosa TaxID=75947 RepID=A0AAU9PW76_9ASTR|nr:unnamed protein product [Lactuca virosa]